MTNQPPPPRTRLLRPFTTRLLNPVTRRFVHWLPAFALIGHRGRKSGRWYWTPMNVFRQGDSYVFALTYGSDVHWVKNVLAAGGAKLRIRRQTIELTDPQLFIDPTRGAMPAPVRVMLGVMRVSEFMQLKIVSGRQM